MASLTTIRPTSRGGIPITSLQQSGRPKRPFLQSPPFTKTAGAAVVVGPAPAPPGYRWEYVFHGSNQIFHGAQPAVHLTRIS